MSTSAIEKGPNRSSGGGLVRLGTDVAGTIYHESDVAGAGKQLAVWLHSIGARGIGETQAKFNRNPLWRSA